jgi:hypothetical protein
MGVQLPRPSRRRRARGDRAQHGLAPRPGALSLQRYGAPPSAGVRVAGAAIGDDTGDPYRSANLAAPTCAPVAL